MSNQIDTPFEAPAATSVEHRNRHGGDQYRFKFPNGYGASVIRHDGSYGGEDGLWELAVLGADGHLTYDTPITNDVIGYQDEAQVSELLRRISDLDGGES